MDEQKSVILAIASRILSYPSDSFIDERTKMNDWIQENLDLDEIKKEITEAIKPILALPIKELREIYVATFDLKLNLSLYLTAHELGDSPKRGAALIKLQKIINESGFECIERELVDYMPMLYEFLAVAPENDHNERLIRRLSCATQRILNHMPNENPYFSIFSILMRFVFQKPTDEEIEKLEQEREEADLEDLPYPIMYS